MNYQDVRPLLWISLRRIETVFVEVSIRIGIRRSGFPLRQPHTQILRHRLRKWIYLSASQNEAEERATILVWNWQENVFHDNSALVPVFPELIRVSANSYLN